MKNGDLDGENLNVSWRVCLEAVAEAVLMMMTRVIIIIVEWPCSGDDEIIFIKNRPRMTIMPEA